MKTIAILLSTLISMPALGQSIPESKAPSSPMESIAPVVITAPRLSKEEIRRLERARTGGGIVAVSGVGLILYGTFVVGATMTGWGGLAVLLGGLTSYLAHRRLHGQDTYPTEAAAPMAARKALP